MDHHRLYVELKCSMINTHKRSKGRSDVHLSSKGLLLLCTATVYELEKKQNLCYKLKETFTYGYS